MHGVAGGTALSTASAASAGRGVQWAAWEREGGTLLVVLVNEANAPTLGNFTVPSAIRTPMPVFLHGGSNPHSLYAGWTFV